MKDYAVLSEELQDLALRSPEELLCWAEETHGERAAIFTSFQNTGCALIHMAQTAAPSLRVVTVDTLRLPCETYALMDRLEQRYQIIIERFRPDPAKLRAMIEEHGPFLFFDSQAKQEHCCKVRKVEPNQRALATVDVWISGLRRDQSDSRGRTPKASILRQDHRLLVKLCPLADWDERDVWDYIRRCDVPYNALYDKGYASIGCEVCSTPIMPWEEKRAGRWRWQNQLGREQAKECGIHIQGSGI